MFECVASQPIFNARKEIFGYELLYRAGQESSVYDGIDGSSATKDVLVKAFIDIGIEEITGGRKAFVNFPAELIVEGVPLMLSNDVLVVELLEDVKPTEKILKACAKLKQQGYLLALDDFVYRPELEPLIKLTDIVKIDFLRCDEKKIRHDVKAVNYGRQKILLAEKIETHEMFELAKEIGFTLFQGFFFCKPTISTSKRVDSMKGSRLQLLRYLTKEDISFASLAEVIKRDVVLSYRLLKIVNSAYYGLQYTVTGILHALTILGLSEIKKWISLIVLNQTNIGRPNELIRTALVRGMFMERLALHMRKRKLRDEYFLIGLFSLANIIMGGTIESIMYDTHLSPSISEPLITGKGERAELLRMIEHIEKAEWMPYRILRINTVLSRRRSISFIWPRWWMPIRCLSDLSHRKRR